MSRKFVLVLAALAFLVTTAATTAPVPAPSTDPAMFTTYTALNCRTGPDISYPRLLVLPAHVSYPIIGRTDKPDYSTWWYLNVNGTRCWSSAYYGYASGDLSLVTVYVFQWPYAYNPYAYPCRYHDCDRQEGWVKVHFVNATGGAICEIDLLQNGEVVIPITWRKGWFPDGTTRRAWVIAGTYDRIKVYNCKPKVVVSTPNVKFKENTEFTLVP